MRINNYLIVYNSNNPFSDNKQIARRGGNIAKNARKEYEE